MESMKITKQNYNFKFWLNRRNHLCLCCHSTGPQHFKHTIKANCSLCLEFFFSLYLLSNTYCLDSYLGLFHLADGLGIRVVLHLGELCKYGFDSSGMGLILPLKQTNKRTNKQTYKGCATISILNIRIFPETKVIVCALKTSN